MTQSPCCPPRHPQGTYYQAAISNRALMMRSSPVLVLANLGLQTTMKISNKQVPQHAHGLGMQITRLSSLIMKRATTFTRLKTTRPPLIKSAIEQPTPDTTIQCRPVLSEAHWYVRVASNGRLTLLQARFFFIQPASDINHALPATSNRCNHPRQGGQLRAPGPDYRRRQPGQVGRTPRAAPSPCAIDIGL